MRRYHLEREVDWKQLLQYMEEELELRMALYSGRGDPGAWEIWAARFTGFLALYDDLRGFLGLSGSTELRQKAGKFLQKGPPAGP